MIYVLLFLGLIFYGISFLLTAENAGYLLSGYNTMKREDQEKFDLQGYLPFFRKFHQNLAISLVGIGLLLYFLASETVAGIFIGIYPIAAYLWFVVKARKYSERIKNNSSKWAVVIMAASLALVVGLFFLGFRKNEMTVGNSEIKIGGMYGETIKMSDVVRVGLSDELPSIKMKSNGFAVGKTRKGYFKTKTGERVMLLIDTEEKPMLLLTLKDSTRLYYASGGVSSTALKSSIERAKASAQN
ncbi:hypothetical protein GCM10023091_02960 [Ravibacter arvi]|uniref:DUF3784 domain-containing protein n=1 Tax=Ravibacter arvi TaxID=2051041 RepID=A0ABP8LLK2_9BACT